MLSGLLALTLAAMPASTAVAQPANDDLAGATEVTSVPFTDSVDATEASLQGGEPDFTCAPVHSSVWYAVTLPRTTTVEVDTTGSDYDTVLSVFSGTGFADFDLVACNDDSTSLQARASFTATAGDTFYVQAAGFGEPDFDAAGQLQISFTRGKKGPTTIKESSRGRAAVAEWFSDEEFGFSETFVEVFDGRRKAGRGKPAAEATLTVFHFSEEFDPDTDAVTFTDFFGTATLQPSQFAIDRKLRNAFVNADLTLNGSRCVFTGDFEEENDENGFEEECEFFTVDVAVSVTWEGHGGIVRSRFHEREHGDDFRVKFRSSSASRDAFATGSIAGDVDLAAGPADFAALSRSAFSSMVWFRNGSGLFFE